MEDKVVAICYSQNLITSVLLPPEVIIGGLVLFVARLRPALGDLSPLLFFELHPQPLYASCLEVIFLHVSELPAAPLCLSSRLLPRCLGRPVPSLSFLGMLRPRSSRQTVSFWPQNFPQSPSRTTLRSSSKSVRGFQAPFSTEHSPLDLMLRNGCGLLCAHQRIRQI
eukprot:4481935-Amphidinium_carterae.1